jgi:PAS domain S-box-containing protein
MFRTIRSSLILLVLGAIAPFVILFVLAVDRAAESRREDAEHQALTYARVIAARVDTYVDGLQRMFLALGQSISMDPAATEANHRLLAAIKANLPAHVEDIEALTPDGTWLGSASGMRQENADRRAFFAALRRPGMVASVIAPSPTTGELTVIIGAVVHRQSDQSDIVLSASSRLLPFGELIDPGNLSPGTTITMMDEQGVVLARTSNPAEIVGKYISDRPAVRRALETREGGGEIVTSEGATRLTGYTTARSVPWLVFVGLPAVEAFTARREEVFIGLAAGAVALAAAVAMARLLGRRIARPLQQLATDAQTLAAGDLAHRSGVRPNGEIGHLAESFNSMAADLATRAAHLRKSEERYRQVVEHMLEAIWVHDGERFVFANSPAAQILGATGAGELVGQPIMARVHPDDRERAMARTRAVTEHGRIAQLIEQRFLRLDGGAVTLEVRAAPIDYDGRPCVMAVARDITQRRQTEHQLRQAQKMEAVGQLTGGVAHDFNNLLTVIMGNLGIAADRVRADPDASEAIAAAIAGAKRGAALTHRLLAFSRRQTLQPHAFDLNQLVTGLRDLLHRTLGENIEIEISLRRGLWMAIADRGQVENSLLNLAINARDAMPAGGRLTIETSNSQLDAAYAAANAEVTPGDYVMLAVSDTGTGMTPGVLERAFEPFFTTKEVGKGTGLGLSMVYGFAKQSGGHAKIYSEVGHGTTIRLYLPRADADDVALLDAAAAPAPMPRGHEKVLVVEDDPAVRRVVVKQLTELGYHVLEAEDGRKALAMISSGAAIDLLFTDVVMPGGLSGRQLAAAAKAHLPALKVLYTSGYTENSIVHHGKLDPGVYLLSKPYQKPDLAQKLREVLDGGGPG